MMQHAMVTGDPLVNLIRVYHFEPVRKRVGGVEVKYEFLLYDITKMNRTKYNDYFYR